jgi:hypothetical protein
MAGFPTRALRRIGLVASCRSGRKHSAARQFVQPRIGEKRTRML